MPSTTVRMAAGAKDQLDRLQARLLLDTGRSITKEEILATLLRLGEAEYEWLACTFVPVDDIHRRNFRTLPVRTGGARTREQDIDRDLYGA